jgi:AraC family transcriptional regulator
MDKNASPKADKTPQTSPEAPFTTFIQLDGKSAVPSLFRTPGTFTITRLQSPAGLPDRITKLSPVPALLVSISLKSLPSSSYQVWTADKLIATSIVHPFRSNGSISIHSQGAGQVVPSITFTILSLVRD